MALLRLIKSLLRLIKALLRSHTDGKCGGLPLRARKFFKYDSDLLGGGVGVSPTPPPPPPHSNPEWEGPAPLPGINTDRYSNEA